MNIAESPCNHCKDYHGWIKIENPNGVFVDRPWCHRHDEVCQPYKHGCIKERRCEVREEDYADIPYDVMAEYFAARDRRRSAGSCLTCVHSGRCDTYCGGRCWESDEGEGWW